MINLAEPAALSRLDAAVPAAAGDRRPGQRRLRSARGLPLPGLLAATAGVVVLGWAALLATQLPARATAWHWPAAWTGLDVLEALGLLATGLLLIRRDARCCLTAAATAALLLTDAWLDIMTAPAGSGRAIAITMAALAELPTAACCAALALRQLPRGARPGSAEQRSPEQRSYPVITRVPG